MWGTMIGVLFFLAQAFAAAMYAVGVAEVVVDLTSNYGQDGYLSGTEINDVRVVSVLILTVLMGISFLGAQFLCVPPTLSLIGAEGLTNVAVPGRKPSFSSSCWLPSLQWCVPPL